jgi:glutaredoxin
MKRNRSTALARPRPLAWLPWLVLATGLVMAGSSHALYKVVGPDGKVTYTDRAPNEGRVSPLGARAAAESSAVAFPLELREAISRYPVTLYTINGACDPCDAARQLLRRRGVPHAEKQVMGPEDSEALQRLSGGLDAPTLTIGSQVLRGLAPEVWGQYLDSAGYPRESRLPQGYQYPAATPVTERREAAQRPAAAPRAAAPTADAAPAAAPAPAPGSIRF